MFAKHLSDKGIAPKIQKELQKPNKEANQLIDEQTL